MYGCENNRVDMVLMMIKKLKIDLNKMSKHGWTGFIYACENDHPKVVELLINYNPCIVE